MTILSIDTSSKACSCSVIRDGKLLSECYLNTGLTHSRTLASVIRRTLEQAEVLPNEIDRVAVTNGPGSYTGLRIGVAAAKGFAAAYNIPCVGVSTLLSLAQNVSCHEGYVLAALDARVKQVYAALFKTENGVITRLTEDDAIPLDRLCDMLPEKALVVGDGAELVCSLFPGRLLTPAPEALRYQRASSAGFIAENSDTVSAEKLLPDYHRKSQAEREREARENIK